MRWLSIRRIVRSSTDRNKTRQLAEGGRGLNLRRTLRVLCCLLLALPVAAVGQTSVRDTLPIVSSVRIEGNQAFPDDEIQRAIATRGSGCRSVLLTPFCWIGVRAFVRTQRFDPRELRTDLARIKVFYYRRGYRAARVDTTLVRDNDRVRIAFTVVEGEPVVIRSFKIEGLDSIRSMGSVLSSLPTRAGRPFSDVDLTATRERIERGLRNRGYAEAVGLVDAEIPSSDSMGAIVTLTAMPGPRASIGEIDIAGTSKLDPEDVKRLLTFRSGDPYNESEIVRSQRSLYSMALFNYVDIARGPLSEDSIIDVRVQVNEAAVRGVQFGFGLSTTECLQLEAGWAHRNFFGGTRKLELSGVLSNLGTSGLAQRFPCSQAGVALEEDAVVRGPFNKVNWRLRADFSQPWFLGTENWLNLGIFSERQSLPGIYARVSNGGDVRLSREIDPGSALIGTYRAGRDSLVTGSADFLFCANFGVCRPDDITTLSKPRWLTWMNVTFARSRTDAVLNPTRGYRLTVEAEHGSRLTGSEWAYYRAQSELSWYQRLGRRNVLALRLRGGLVRPIGAGIEGPRGSDFSREDPVTHPLKRQYAGGAFTVRGYGQNLLGPKVLLVEADSALLPACFPQVISEDNTWICDPNSGNLSSADLFPRPVGGENSVVANVELRVPFSPQRWSGVVFIDVGQVWTKGSQFETTKQLAWSPGFGIRYHSPVGPLRLDIGYNTGGRERLPVVTEVSVTGEDQNDSERRIVQLGDQGRAIPFEYDPFERSGLRGFLNRLQLHFSIGQAF